jgi:hypothetical protein
LGAKIWTQTPIVQVAEVAFKSGIDEVLFVGARGAVDGAGGADGGLRGEWGCGGASVDGGGVRARGGQRAGGGGGEVDFGGREETIVGVVRPVYGDGGGEGDEEGVKVEEVLAIADEAVAEAGPVDC